MPRPTDQENSTSGDASGPTREDRRGAGAITEEQIRHITETIVREYRPDRIIIFGSCARGDQNARSDLDIMVISDREKHLPLYQRGLRTRLLLPEDDVPTDILFYTHEEIERWKDVRLSFVARVLREGKVVYEQP